MVRLAIGLLILALGGACYLLFVSLRDGPVLGCGTGSSCDSVLKGRWAYFLPGIPVSAPAVVVYLVLLHGLLVPGSRGVAWKGRMMIGALLVLGAATWFIGLQALVIGSYCKWCMAIHLCGMIGAGCVLAAIRPFPPRFLPKGGAAAILGLAVLAGCQFLFPQGTTMETRLKAGTVRTEGSTITIGQVAIDLDKVPHRGNLDSGKHVLILTDYTCFACRVMHRHFYEAEEHFGKDSFLLVTLPVPLNPACNPHFAQVIPEHRNACEYTRLGLALWFAERTAFESFDRWIYQSGTLEEAPVLDEVRSKAEELLGKEELAKALEDPRVAKQMADGIAAWKTLVDASETVNMPKLLVGDRLESGRFMEATGLYGYLEGMLGLTPIGTE